MVAHGIGSPIDKPLIVATALRLLDEVGLDGLTLRRLAAELGVKAPALYWHVRGKRDLLDAMAEEIVATSVPDAMRAPAPGQDWADWLVERARAIRRTALARRDGALVMVGNRPSAAALPGIERMLATLVDAGLTPADAFKAVFAVGSYTMGWVVEEQAERRREADASNPAEVAAIDRALAARMRDGDDFPHLAAAVTALGGDFTEAAFEFGLRALVDGLRQRARPPAGP